MQYIALSLTASPGIDTDFPKLLVRERDVTYSKDLSDCGRGTVMAICRFYESLTLETHQRQQAGIGNNKQRRSLSDASNDRLRTKDKSAN